MTDDIYHDPNPPAWPHNGIPFNRWYINLPEFIRRLASFQWYKGGHRFKYVRITVDTRNGNFVIFDRDGKAACPDDLFPQQEEQIMTTEIAKSREIIIVARKQGRSVRIEKFMRIKHDVTPLQVETVYDTFVDDKKTQTNLPADATIRWLGNALEDGS